MHCALCINHCALCIVHYELCINHCALCIENMFFCSFVFSHPLADSNSSFLISHSSFPIGSSADGFATAGCLSGNTRFGISPSHFVGSSLLIGSSADGFATAGCLSGNTRFGISPSHFVGSSLLISNYASCIGSVFLCLPLMCRFSHFHDFLRARALWSRLVNW